MDIYDDIAMIADNIQDNITRCYNNLWERIVVMRAKRACYKE